CVRTREPAILFSTGALLWRTCKERHERGEFGIREALSRSGWTQARSMAARATPKPSRAASPNGTCRGYRRGKKNRYGGLGCPRRKKMNSCTTTTTTELTGEAF